MGKALRIAHRRSAAPRMWIALRLPRLDCTQHDSSTRRQTAGRRHNAPAHWPRAVDEGPFQAPHPSRLSALSLCIPFYSVLPLCPGCRHCTPTVVSEAEPPLGGVGARFQRSRSASPPQSRNRSWSREVPSDDDRGEGKDRPCLSCLSCLSQGLISRHGCPTWAIVRGDDWMRMTLFSCNCEQGRMRHRVECHVPRKNCPGGAFSNISTIRSMDSYLAKMHMGYDGHVALISTVKHQSRH